MFPISIKIIINGIYAHLYWLIGRIKIKNSHQNWVNYLWAWMNFKYKIKETYNLLDATETQLI